MRTLNELYIILWNEIKDAEYLSGLCAEIYILYSNSLIISKFEYILLDDHFKSQKPSKDLHAEFLESDSWTGGEYWWDKKENDNPVNRKAFVQKMIEITK